ncbi:peptidylprolyl isomerase [Salinimicrobium catena]|uniref:peptidylprolyl isomerase n=1 Tax=Salinimicrobium catena TaxID=390640 RepID=A0A1H5MQZ7_9FLAO|nr:peptidylprolyl isomerase [Salinimicrobium catena]SDL26987.1 peptidylprolyl isomerase [Salinimicrobium catena]SEE91061.1 peptidylprolyl isomerase [Salinimicrobium catena]
MKKISLLLFGIVLMSFTACNEEYPDLEDGMYAEFKTNKGIFVAELFYEATPMTVASFVSLAEGESTMVQDDYKEKKFYNGLTFHRVIEDFMIQGGDPQGTGSGGPGYKFPNEIVDTLKHDSKGILSMANSGPNTNGSQFFVTLKDTPWLNGMHTVFGEVVQGQEVVDQIGSVETGPNDKPVEPVVMEEVNIIRKGSDAKNFQASKVLSKELQDFKAEAEAKEQKMTELRNAKKTRYEELKTEAKELESGLQITFLEEGEGPQPKLGDTVMVNYEGYLPDGHLFDSNIEQVAEEAGMLNQRRKEMGGYAPMAVLYSPDAPMIPGFKEGVQQMKVGDKAVLFIPAHLGYGERGAPPVIPPSSDLIFEIELVKIQE